jgi:hypothetical protein
MKKGSGNAGSRKIPQTNTGDFPSSLENAKNAFSTFPLPDDCCYSLSSEATAKPTPTATPKPKPERSTPPPFLRALQAHLSIRKD